MTGRGRPFLFCRYSISVADEVLDGGAQNQIFRDLQGTVVSHRGGPEDTLLMQPRRAAFEDSPHTMLSWSVGQLLGHRRRANYDTDNDRIEFDDLEDGGLRYTDFVAIPAIGALAVDDRSGDLHLGGKQAINRLRSIVETVDGAEANISFVVTQQEVRRALSDWQLDSFKFTVRPNNPIPVGRHGEMLSEQFKKDGIGKLMGTARPEQGRYMAADQDGFIMAATDLVEAGYGQMAISGVTDEGIQAELKKPPFDFDRQKNTEIQARPRELRVYVPHEGVEEADILKGVARALMGFYSDG